MHRPCPAALCLALACAACSADDGRTSGVGDDAPADTTSTSGIVSDSIATAWESTIGTTGPDTGTPSTTGADDTTDAPGTESTSTTDPTTDTPGTSDDTSSTGGPPTPINLLENPSVEEWTNAEEPNTTPDAWENCSSGGAAVDAVPDSCDEGIPEAQVGLRYARGVGGEGIEQTIDTVPGTTYRISFDYTAVDDCFGGGPSTRWEVVVDEDQILVTRNMPGIAWASAEVNFDATQPTTTICFRKFANGEGGIDNLSVLALP